MYSDTHATLGKDDPVTGSQYWDYSFQKIGEEDVPAYVDAIVAARGGADCSKVTIVPHSTAVDATMVAALTNGFLADKVDQVASVGPCFKLGQNYWIAGRDFTTIEAYKTFLDLWSINYLFSPDHDTLVSNACANATGMEPVCQAVLGNIDY